MKCELCLLRGEDEDVEDLDLQLNVTEHHYQKFNIKDDGTLEYIDSDADQEMYLECPLCGTKYDIGVDYQSFALQMEERHVITRLDLIGNYRNNNPIVNLNDYKITERKGN